jgi:hypothetical protein
LKKLHTERIFRIWSLILLWRGKSKYKQSFPLLKISNKVHRTEPKGTYKVAEYCFETNQVTVWWKKHSHFKELTSSLLHEYTHYLQFWPWYSRYANIHKYVKNPYEIEARESEKLTNIFIQCITNYSWKKLLKEEPRLLKIYNKVSSSVVIEN